MNQEFRNLQRSTWLAGGEWTDEWLRVAVVANILVSDVSISTDFSMKLMRFQEQRHWPTLFTKRLAVYMLLLRTIISLLAMTPRLLEEI